MSESANVPRAGADFVTLAGRRILVVEDELLVAMMIEDLLLALGCEVVGPVNSVSKALQLAAVEALDGAVLDVNLEREKVYPVAEFLHDRRVPYVFLTGYGPCGIAEPHRHHPMIQKPFPTDQFGSDLRKGLARCAVLRT